MTQEPKVGMHVRPVGYHPYWTGRDASVRATILEVTDSLVILDSTEKASSQRWSKGAFWTMWEEVPDRYHRDIGI
jgi:hypothetical protein